MMRRKGNSKGIRLTSQLDCGVLGTKSTPLVRNNSRSPSLGNPGGAVVENSDPSVNDPVIPNVVLFNLTSSTLSGVHLGDELLEADLLAVGFREEAGVRR